VHIPDGYLSPATCATCYAGMAPVWITAGRRVQRIVKSRYVPLVAFGAAYSFLVMMFNIPVPDGTTAHAVGAVLIGILLGPWAAVIAVSVALLIQALLFGDGGVLSFGANALNMAFVMPFVGYAVYKVASGRSPISSRRRVLAAAVAGYAGLNAAALTTAVELGLQPDLFHTADGTPLYSPFHLGQTIPAMLLAHLLVAGAVEGVLTAGVIAYLQRANPPILRINGGNVPGSSRNDPVGHPGRRWAVLGLAAMAVLTPLGLLANGGAFGEDSPQDLVSGGYGLDAVPHGLARYSTAWTRALLRGYGFRSGDHRGVAYALSAVVGVLAIIAAVYAGVLATRFVGRIRKRRALP